MYIYIYTCTHIYNIHVALYNFSPFSASITTPQRFLPEKTLFKDISKINPVLLQDVVNCYKKYKFVCRTCFFRHNCQEAMHTGKPCRQCKNTAAIRVIPASRMCKNFRDLKVLAIPPPPKMLMSPGNHHKPFQYCRNEDHMLCYDRAKESWYAHSIEEIVIWTVERYWGEIHVHEKCKNILTKMLKDVHVGIEVPWWWTIVFLINVYFTYVECIEALAEHVVCLKRLKTSVCGSSEPLLLLKHGRVGTILPSVWNPASNKLMHF